MLYKLVNFVYFSSLKIWEVDEFIPVHSYDTAHARKITSIDVMPKSETVFLSTSMDHTVSIWDSNKSTTPAQGIHQFLINKKKT